MSVEYRDINGFPGYKIGTDGTILSNKRRKGYINTFVGSSGYKFATLYNNGKRNTIALHRLLATTFIPNPDNLPMINHKDENPLNNDLSNLEWCSGSYNRTYGNCEAKRVSTIAQSKSVAQFSLDGDLLNVFPSCSAAAKSLNIGGSAAFSIGQCALGHTKQSHGYIWKYIKPESINNKENDENINKLVKELYDKVFPILSSYKEPLKKEFEKLNKYRQEWEKKHPGEEHDNTTLKIWAISAPFTALDILKELY